MHILKRAKIITETDPNQQWLCKLKLLAYITHFVWLLKLDRILHNQVCVRRGIILNPFCKSCGMIDSVNHIFRTCHQACNVSKAVMGIDNYDLGDTNFFMWIYSNLHKDMRLNMNWSTIFVAIIWNI